MMWRIADFGLFDRVFKFAVLRQNAIEGFSLSLRPYHMEAEGLRIQIDQQNFFYGFSHAADKFTQSCFTRSPF